MKDNGCVFVLKTITRKSSLRIFVSVQMTHLADPFTFNGVVCIRLKRLRLLDYVSEILPMFFARNCQIFI